MGGGPQWKREVVPDHKFDFIDTREFTDNGFGMRMKYLFLYGVVLKSFLVYVSDIFTAITMLSATTWSNDIFQSCKKGDDKDPPQDQSDSDCIVIPFEIGKWIFFGCIIFGFLLLAYESRKAKKIIASRDISYAFTNVLANNYYSLRSYDHFCFFDHISNSTKKKDDFAFFVFFTFKGWKRLILADGPRQSINAITMYSFYLAKSDVKKFGPWDNFGKYFNSNDMVGNVMKCTMLFTVLVFAVSLLLLVAAAICYIPLLCYIRGNLKEYCCHKVDKRIAEIIKRRNKARQAKAMALAKKEAEGDFSHLKNKNAEGAALPQPTLPNVSIDDDEFDGRSTRGAPAPSTYTTGNDSYYYSDSKAAPAGGYDAYGAEYPPMPGYNPAQVYGQYPSHAGQHGQELNPSVIYGEREPYFQDGYSQHQGAHGQQQSGQYDPYSQHGQMHPEFPQHSDYSQHSNYDHHGVQYAQDYPSPISGGTQQADQAGYHQQQAYGGQQQMHRRGPSGGGAGGYAV